MYLALYKLKGPGIHTVLIHIWSNLAADYPQQIQDYLDAAQDPDCDMYDPLFPWGSARVVAMYRGLAKEAEEWKFYLPDGREAQMWNINLGCTNRMAEAMKDYAAAMDAAREVLLKGGTSEMAARKLWNFCVANGVAQAMIDIPRKFYELEEEMEQYRVILAEDLQNMGSHNGFAQGLLS